MSTYWKLVLWLLLAAAVTAAQADEPRSEARLALVGSATPITRALL